MYFPKSLPIPYSFDKDFTWNNPNDPSKDFTITYANPETNEVIARMGIGAQDPVSHCYNVTLHQFGGRRLWVSDETDYRVVDTEHHMGTWGPVCTKWAHFHADH
jgi:hypothetical protein